MDYLTGDDYNGLRFDRPRNLQLPDTQIIRIHLSQWSGRGVHVCSMDCYTGIIEVYSMQYASLNQQLPFCE